MREYFHVPFMYEWQSRPETAEEVKSGRGDLSFATFLLNEFCSQIADGSLTVAIDLNGREIDDFIWDLECVCLALSGLTLERSE